MDDETATYEPGNATAPEAHGLLGGPYDAQKADAYLATILTFTGDPGTEPEDPRNVVLYQNGLLVVNREGTIDSVQPHDRNRLNYNTYDYRGCVIIAGFVDAHVHYVQMDAIAGFGQRVLQWLDQYIYPAEKKFSSPTHAQEVADFFLDTLLANGTTTASVFSTKFASSAEVFFEAAHRRNMRMLTGKMLMDNPLAIPVEDLRDKTVDGAIKASRDLATKWHGKGRQLYSVCPRFAIACTPEMLRAASDHYRDTLGRKNLPMWMHTHLSENSEEEDVVRTKWFPDIMGKIVPGGSGEDDRVQTFTDVYRYFGLVGPRTMFGHCVAISDRDRQNLSNAGASLAHCPTSNFFLGSGSFNLYDALLKNIRVGMATDCGGGTSYSLLTTMGESYNSQAIKAPRRKATCTHPGSPEEAEGWEPTPSDHPRLTAWRAFYLATLGGAKALHLDENTTQLDIGPPIGSLRSGNAADFVVLDLAATPVIKRRIERVEKKDQAGAPRSEYAIWHEKLFAVMMLGDDRVVKATYIMGKKAYQRGTTPMAPVRES